MAGKKSEKAPVVMGWREWVALPEFGVRSIKAKLDTGARTSSLHAFKIRRFIRDGRPMARFEVHPVQRSTASSVEVEAEILEERSVRNSGGTEETRPVILTTVELGGRRLEIELTLTRRDEMGFRLLLGRQALRGRYVVDPARSFLADGDRTRRPKARKPKGQRTRTRSESGEEE